MSFDPAGVPFPTTQTPAGLYQHQIQMTAFLRRALGDIGSGEDLAELAAEVAASNATFTTQINTANAAIAANATAITGNTSAINSANMAIAGNTTQINANTAAHAALVTTVTNANTTFTADILQLQADVATAGMTPQQIFELSLVTAVATALGSPAEMFASMQSRQEADAEAAMQAGLNAYKNVTGIFQEQTVRATETDALAQDLKVVAAYLGGSGSTVADFSQAVANGDQALALRVLKAETQVAGNTSSVGLLLESVNGIGSRAGLVVNSQNQVIGSAILNGSQQGSDFTVVADKFLVAIPNNGIVQNVFAVGLVNGVPAVAILGDLIADGAIIARNIAAGTITADKIFVNDLSAISANVGILRSGQVRNFDDTLIFDMSGMRIYRTDGTAEVDLNAKRIRFTA